jgi:DNA methyltransferase 1-associated protein 1
LQLGHWVKTTDDPDAGVYHRINATQILKLEHTEYSFAKYNVQSQSYTYSQEEYTRFLEGKFISSYACTAYLLVDKDWTKDETDILFNVVREYDTRWYVVHDRYEPPPDSPTRSLEVKHQSFCSCTALTCNRISRTDTTVFAENSFGIDPGQAMRRVKLSFSIAISLTKVRDSCDSVTILIALDRISDRERMRKDYIASLEDRTPEEIAEEEALFIELKRLEQNERKFKKERDELLRTLLGIDSGLPDIVAEEDGLSALSAEGFKKRKKNANEIEIPSTPSNIISLGPPPPKRAQSAKSAAYGTSSFGSFGTLIPSTKFILLL